MLDDPAKASDPDTGRGPLSENGTFRIAPSDCTDGRAPGDFASRYPWSAWVQIIAEGAYLVILIVIALLGILTAAARPDRLTEALNALTLGFAPPQAGPLLRALQLWVIVALSGVLGSASFSLKWLYHSVAWMVWNRDRVLWRLSVPIEGGILSLFIGAMIISGIIPLISRQFFLRILSCAGFGFFVGLFADNFLAALQKFATRLLGTLGKSL